MEAHDIETDHRYLQCRGARIWIFLELDVENTTFVAGKRKMQLHRLEIDEVVCAWQILINVLPRASLSGEYLHNKDAKVGCKSGDGGRFHGRSSRDGGCLCLRYIVRTVGASPFDIQRMHCISPGLFS